MSGASQLPRETEPPITWGRALRERDFASIADWFIRYFFGAGAVALALSGLAVGIDQTFNVAVAPGHGIAAGLRVFALSSLFAAACTVSGWLLGLLFGVPRTLARGQIGSGVERRNGGEAIQPDQTQDRRSAASRVNTNLEDISDWLTKTIVGVGLTQLFAMPSYLWKVAGVLNTNGLGWDPYGRLLALGLFFYFAPGGFWLGYVGTRTILTKLFELIEGPGTDAGLTTLAEDANSLRIKNFVWPSGPAQAVNQANLDRVRQWMSANLPAGAPPIAIFLNAPAFAAERRKAVADLNIP